MKTSLDVALILWNKDVIQLVSLVLLKRNLKSDGIEPSDGPQEIERLIATCNPSVVVFDLEPPYERSADVIWRLLQQFDDCSFVLTCADPVLALRSAPWLSRYPIFQKPYQLDEMEAIICRLTTAHVANV